jgi:hypothetical protein
LDPFLKWGLDWDLMLIRNDPGGVDAYIFVIYRRRNAAIARER